METYLLQSINDANIYAHTDDGVTRDGDDQPGRSRFKRALAKRISLSDGASVPVFVLASEPQHKPHPDDPVARLLCDDDGMWKKPTKRWLDEKARRIAAAEASSNAATARVRALAGNQIADALSRVAQMGDVGSASVSSGKVSK